MESYLGTVWAFGFGFTPVGWMQCNGQLVNISDYDALYSLLGTTFGGDGQTTFGLPDLRGRIPIGAGQGPGLANYALGQLAGSESVTLTSANLPPHSHAVTSATIPVADTADAASPANAYFAPADASVGDAYIDSSAQGNAVVAGTMTAQPTGGNQPIQIISPYQVVNYCICVEGIYPPQP